MSNNKRNIARTALAWLLLHAGLSWGAAPDIDIRVLSPITSSQQAASYGLSVSDCSQVKSVKVGAGSDMVTMDSSLAQTIVGTPGCVYPFTANSLSPQAHITLLDGSQSTYSENFQVSTQSPSISFKGVAIEEGSNGQQVLVVSVTAAADPVAAGNVDVAYLSFDVTGLRASELRKSGGVVHQARQKAFTRSAGYQRVYPTRDDQTQFVIRVPVEGTLSPEAIQSDLLVLVEGQAVDKEMLL